MRTFTDIEQRLMRFMVSQKENDDFHPLEIAKIIEYELDIIAMRRDEKSVSLCDAKKVKNELFFKFADILNLIRELEQNNLIVISRSCDITHEKEQVYFDRTKYVDIYHIKTRVLRLIEKDKQEEYNRCELEFGMGCRINLNAHRLFGDIADLFFNYGNGTILPLPALEDLVKYDFRSVEQRNFEKQLSKTNWSIGIAAAALIVSAIMPFIIMKCSPDTDKQVEVIESAIKSTKTEYPTKIDVSLQDTLIIKDIDSNPIINKIYYGEEK